MTPSNPFDNSEIVAGYEAWYHTAGCSVDRQEKALLKQVLSSFPVAHSVLEVGCGSGHFTDWFNKQGLRTIGLDLSLPMLEEAKRLRNLACLQGDAHTLPFLSASFDLVALITTLEFLSDPVQALAEAIRVAGQGLILGVLNAQSCLGRQYKRKGGPIWEAARFFTPHELKCMLQKVAGVKAKVVWRTTLWPLWSGVLPLPWGGFIGMAVKLL
jgi:ubiquinone/menaquinone biosynthesis C-methylase UbiE